MDKGNTIVSLDLGTTKICALVGELSGDHLDVVGVGMVPSKGLRRGVVINIDETVEAVRAAVNAAEVMSGYRIKSAYVGIAGGHIKSMNSSGVVAISRGREITQMDIDRAIETARVVSIPNDREVIHVIPQSFAIDDQEGIHNPIGMMGSRLEVEVHLVTGAVASAQNLIKSVEKAGLGVADVMLEPIASGRAVLTDDEMDLGVILIDMGGGTTDIAVYTGGSIRHTSVLAIGSAQITNDIAIGLRTPIIQAEELKCNFGRATTDGISPTDQLEVPGVGGRPARRVPLVALVEIITPRLEEILTLARREVQKSGFSDRLAGGIVLTGGGSKIVGITEIAEKVFDLPARIGTAMGVGGLKEISADPIYATGAGLLLLAMDWGGSSASFTKLSDGNLFRRLTERMKRWLEGIF